MGDTVVVISEDEDSLSKMREEDPLYKAGINNATSGTSTEESNQNSHGSVHNVVWIYVSPVIFIMGLCGNILIMCVMRRPKLRGSSATVYLPLMAFFDTLVLITGRLSLLSYTYFTIAIYVFKTKIISLATLTFLHLIQECILVGYLPSAAVAVCWREWGVSVQGNVCPAGCVPSERRCLPRGVSAQRGCLPKEGLSAWGCLLGGLSAFCLGWCTPFPLDRQTPVKT